MFEFVRLVAEVRTTGAIAQQLRAFGMIITINFYIDKLICDFFFTGEGFFSILPARYVAIFTPRQLELLISGLANSIRKCLQ